MRRPSAVATVVLLWLAVLTVAFHGCGRRLGCGGFLVRRTGSVAVPARKMLLAVTSFDAAASSSTDHHHHHHHHHRRQHVHRWNRQGIPPSGVGKGEDELDPRYGVQKRLVPTGPNPLHH
ncbi:hypothetical protein SEVIR_3G241500v4 [Setaria viridis]|nr:protein FON2 SPARE1 [Setaria italica]XP_034587773.1 protein FON2 SPARE1-like [Setaria viridis]RCV17641.1 hypothetical protein SETIT_3G236200v2 [Setaria italica]TKW27182.1 hypothetical protein SEVIR_3G241500v2 [Setaria viridis]